jgi:hypothetical protein
MFKTIDEFGQIYAERLESADDPKKEAEIIANEINSLVYENTDDHISQGDREKIITKMVQSIRPNMVFKGASNQATLALITYISKLIEVKKP